MTMGSNQLLALGGNGATHFQEDLADQVFVR